ncbi:uncharacterized protein ddias [Clarias gariepinus]|uniref:uncharacterized protein ddias n=1 Tax=Clarias gariepinus TaxID=13013 RepID=UPI00234E14AF|nr:uncharacterized protein ddias [Clarias gariepinus]
MNTKRVLLSCTVISLQDTRFVYPCCRLCLCRLTQEADLRSRCFKCGFTCDTQNADYRFRLSLKVSRDSRLFAVTVFGGCLNPYFGITAGGLQRFVESEKFEGPQTLQQLLIKAVEDCFIGKCLVFGFKLSGRAAESCLLGEHTAETVQFVACQVIPPNGALLGVTVFGYLQSLMQKNAHPVCFAKAGCQLQRKDSLESSFDHTLPLCQNWCSETSTSGLTLPHPWHSISSLDLCFSLDETSACSLSDVTEEDESKEPSNGVQGAEFCPFTQFGSTPRERNRLSTSHESLFNVSSVSPIKITSSDHELKSLSFNKWSSQDCLSQINAFLPEKPFFSFTLQDAPLSETLGDFVSIEPPIVDRKLSSSTSKRDQGTLENSILIENSTIPRYTSEIQSPHFSFPVLTPFCDVTNVKKSLARNNRKRKSSPVSKHTTKLSHVSQELHISDTKGVVSTSNGGTLVQCPARKEQENQLSGYEDAYNYSADLFQQSSMNIIDVVENSISDTDSKEQKCLAEINIPEPNISSFRFAPSLQSTPVVNSTIQCAYRQRCKLRKKCSGMHWSKKRLAHNRISNRQGIELNQSWCTDSVLKTSDSSAGGSKLKADMKHLSGDSALLSTNNDCSRDLFDPSF